MTIVDALCAECWRREMVVLRDYTLYGRRRVGVLGVSKSGLATEFHVFGEGYHKWGGRVPIWVNNLYADDSRNCPSNIICIAHADADDWSSRSHQHYKAKAGVGLWVWDGAEWTQILYNWRLHHRNFYTRENYMKMVPALNALARHEFGQRIACESKA